MFTRINMKVAQRLISPLSPACGREVGREGGHGAFVHWGGIFAMTVLFCTLVFASTVQAHEFKLGDIQINHPFARATVPGQASGGAYFSLENKGKVDDALVKAESNVANAIELHEMTMKGDVMKMREVKEIDLKAGEKINMQPGGGYHIMLMGLKQPLKIGDKFPLTLTFKKAGKVDVVVYVEANKADASVEHQH